MASPSYPRARRLAETIKRLLGEWLEHEQTDPRIGFVTVTDVRVTPDLAHAKVFYTVLGTPAEVTETRTALGEVVGQARTWVARHVRLRHAPTLEFVPDDLPDRSARIDQLLAEVQASARPAAPDQERPHP